MRRIALILALVALASLAYAQGAKTSPWGAAFWLRAADRSWLNQSGSATSDTVTATGTEAYTAAFQIYDGHALFGWKQKNTTAAADTDTVRVKLYRAPFSDGPWTAIDSSDRGGRGDTNSKPWVVSLAGKGRAGSWFRLGYKKLMGIPMLLGVWREND